MSDTNIIHTERQSIPGTVDIRWGWNTKDHTKFDALRLTRRRCGLEGEWNAMNHWFQLCINKKIYDYKRRNVYHIFQHLDRHYNNLHGKLLKKIEGVPTLGQLFQK